MKRRLTYLFLLTHLNLGLATPETDPHLDKSILKQYQQIAINTTPIQKDNTTHLTIDKIYQNAEPHHSIEARLNYFSQYYVGSPYVLFPLGEGIPSEYDEMPRIRVDGFDCQTYVDTVLALSIAANAKSFNHCLDKIRYLNGKVSFITRNHFTSIDWNKNNQLNGYLKDITTNILDVNGHSIAHQAVTLIDKNSWYKKLPLTRIRVQNLTPEKQKERLRKLQLQGQQFKPTHSTINYIPLKHLIDKQGRANDFVLKQIPSGAIVEIVRPNWQLKMIIGTDLDISHLGFVFWQGHRLYFRQASSTEKKIVNLPFIDYLKEATRNKTIGGINIQVVAPTKPLKNC